jgi:GR25 family glycosyltransferase involved in LPS biosynthesis
MDSDDNYQFYCLLNNNEERCNNMKKYFNKLNLSCIFYSGMNFEDIRIKNIEIDEDTKLVWLNMYGHLDMINDFYNNGGKEFGIFCEDDIYLHKDLKKILKKILFDFKIMNLDILLLSYLLPFKIQKDTKEYPLKHSITTKSIYKYHYYPDYIGGAKMYILSKEQAKKILDKYYYNFAEKTILDKNTNLFSVDNTIIKEGNRALISPLLAIKDNKNVSKNKEQQNFNTN